jgi:hypothetical protein
MSDLFAKYVRDHQKLEINLLPTLRAYIDIEKSGRHLCKENKTLLAIKRSTVSLIPLTTNIIDLVFGKLPGILAEFFGQRLSDMLKDDRRIVIYRFDQVLSEFIKEHPFKGMETDES